jgi:hypothetical protein
VNTDTCQVLIPILGNLALLSFHDTLQGSNGRPIFFTSQHLSSRKSSGLIVLPVLLLFAIVYAPYLLSVLTSESFPQLKAAYQNECFNEYANHLLKEWWLLGTAMPMITTFVMGANFTASMIISIATKPGSKFLRNTASR